jgi:hypothetical protein
MSTLPLERIQNIAGIYGALQQLGGGPSPALIASSMAARSTIAGQVDSKDGWRPPEWGQSLLPNLSDSNSYSSLTCVAAQSKNGLYTRYFFDAVISAQHTTRRQITEHPVQWGAAISDHSYQLPALLTLEVGMSDAMSSFNFGQYSPDSGAGKSVNAYQTFVELQKTGQPFIVNTHLQRYTNMVIENISITDNNKTTYSAKFSISFKEIFIGITSTVSKSTFPMLTAAAEKKTVNAAAAKTHERSAWQMIFHPQ